MAKRKRICIFLGLATILIIVAIWHKNYVEKNVTENPITKPIVTEPVSANPEPIKTKPEMTKETLCTKGQRDADFCAQVYAPVCAEVQIQCIKAPCYPIKETFSSSCEACKNQLVDSYTAGECK